MRDGNLTWEMKIVVDKYDDHWYLMVEQMDLRVRENGDYHFSRKKGVHSYDDNLQVFDLVEIFHQSFLDHYFQFVRRNLEYDFNIE